MTARPFLTPPELRAGVLVAVVTGGRPALKQRPTAQFLPAFAAAGFPPPVWVVSDRHAPGYERDQHELLTYPHEWALDYARAHWMLPTPPDGSGFLGAFPGREWACEEAERRGCWAVLQVDDNVTQLRFLRGTAHAPGNGRGESGRYTDLLAALMLATNVRMLGLSMSAVIPDSKHARTLIRPGFPYSWFLERTGPDREPWLGPYEDDITHALQYGERADGVTAALVPALTYIKETKSKSGMRTRYDETRAVQLQRLLPQAAKIGVRATRANGKGGPRVFHTLRGGAVRNPVTVSDPELYAAVKGRVEDMAREWFQQELAGNRRKVRQRLARAEQKAAEAS